MRWICIFVFLSSCLFCEAKPKLSDYRKNVYSQFGEDGIVEKIFEVIGTNSKVAIEFGAADGFNSSNTANLWAKDPSWKGVLIEADPSLYQQLVRNVASYDCKAIHSKIGISAQDSIETILKEAHIDSPIDLCSIDIDGNDYYIFQSLQQLRPRVIICEYNPSIPAYLDIYPEYDNNIGCSVAALQRVAAEKGYTLVALTDCNCIFVLNEEFPKFADFDTDREHMRFDRCLRYVIIDYSGKYKMIGASHFDEPWGIQGPSPEKCLGNFAFIPVTISQTGRAIVSK